MVILHIFEPNSGRTFVVLETPPEDGMPITFSSSDFDDLIGSEHQQIDSSSARSFTQDLFRLSTENMLETGNVVSVFC